MNDASSPTSATPTANGPAAPPTRRPRRRGRVVVALALVIASTGAGGWLWHRARTGLDGGTLADTGGRMRQVSRMNLDVTVKKEGELEAVKNTEITVEVQGARAITYLIPEGTRAKQGETLAVLASEDLAEEIRKLEQERLVADANLLNAKEALETQLRQNADDVEGAEVLHSLAEMDLQKYELGTYPQALEDVQTRLEMAQIALGTSREHLQNTLALFAKGFVTAQKVKDDRLAVKKAENDAEKAQNDLEVLLTYTHPMELRTRQDKLRQARNRVDRVRDNARTAEFARQQHVQRAQMQVDQLTERLAFKQKELANCTIKAPEPGLVVYFDDGRNDIAAGVQVRHRQTIMLLPDTEHMKAVVRVPENRVGQIRQGMNAVVEKPVDGFSPLTATVARISVLASSDGRWYGRDTREYPVDLVLDHTPEGLKPGLKVEATVFVERLRDVLAVPLQCVYTKAEQAFVFVSHGPEQSIEARPVTLGKANETHAQVLEGLAAGESVLELQVGEGRSLLEKLGIQLPDDPMDSAAEALTRREQQAPSGEASAVITP